MTELRCSAKACSREASWGIRWRNPKIHDEDRRKVWLACDEHRVTLNEFLSLRSFPMDVVPVADLD
ncbi:hypothetical protein [Yimella sp. cx-51]|uniref:hypothetical protein n=1 Tax=Yimella sp. cx-51 TaxID=2770551 RepID=UPI00165D960A|nr:hypothetical protein [Yimella sp. cx-51]MBC9957401.1 hypothetical protein [Yimella sp. cx-51]QTH39359.1 hypothetical protein J5M86_07130 [Yimella sp. cx-51]